MSLARSQTISRKHHVSLPHHNRARQQTPHRPRLPAEAGDKTGTLKNSSQWTGFKYLLFRMSTEPLSVWTTKVWWRRSSRIVPRRDQSGSGPRVILARVEGELCCAGHRCVSLHTCYVRFFALSLFILPTTPYVVHIAFGPYLLPRPLAGNTTLLIFFVFKFRLFRGWDRPDPGQKGRTQSILNTVFTIKNWARSCYVTG